jgi:hypothetical protein
MSTSLILLGYSLIFLLLFSLSILLFIVGRRFAYHIQDKKLKIISESLESEILSAMSAADDTQALKVAETYANYPSVLTELLVEYATAISGLERQRLKLIYERALKSRLLRDLHSRFTHIRLRAIRPYVIFSDEQDYAQILNLIQDKPAIRLAVIDALATAPHPLVIARLFQAYAECPEADLRAYMNVMYSLGKRIEKHVEFYLKESLSGPKLAILIELAGALPIPGLHSQVLAFADHEDKEVRIRVARALGGMAVLVKPIKDVLLKLANDEAWEVQAQAMKSLGRLHIQGSWEMLTKGLFSPHWYCRRNAGLALAGMGDKGIHLLQRIAKQTEDRYAADMASMILNEIAFSPAP